MKRLRTPKDVADWLDHNGMTLRQWARENGYGEHYSLVREVARGNKKCKRGLSHNIAVLLGMKAGVLTSKPARVASSRAAA